MSIGDPLPKLVKVTVRMEWADGRVATTTLPNPGKAEMTLDPEHFDDLRWEPFDPVRIRPIPSSRKVRLDIEVRRGDEGHMVWMEIQSRRKRWWRWWK